MNLAQRAVLFVGVLIIAIMGIYPPWLYIEPDEAPYPMGYGLIWNPPSLKKEAHADLFGLKLKWMLNQSKPIA